MPLIDIAAPFGLKPKNFTTTLYDEWRGKNQETDKSLRRQSTPIARQRHSWRCKQLFSAFINFHNKIVNLDDINHTICHKNEVTPTTFGSGIYQSNLLFAKSTGLAWNSWMTHLEVYQIVDMEMSSVEILTWKKWYHLRFSIFMLYTWLLEQEHYWLSWFKASIRCVFKCSVV